MKTNLRLLLAAALFSVAVSVNAQGWTGQAGGCQSKQIFDATSAGRFSEALDLHRAQLAGLGVPADERSKHAAICLESFIGLSLGRIERHDEAIATLEAALAKSKETLGEQHRQTLETEFFLAVAHGRARTYQKSIPIMQALRVRFGQAYGAKSMRVYTLLNALSNDYHWIANFKEALPLNQEALAIAEGIARDASNGISAKERNGLLGRAQLHIADTLRRLGESAEALPLALDAGRRLTESYGATHPDALDARLLEASILAMQGQRPRALAIEQEVYSAARSALGESHPLTRKAQGNVAVSLAASGSRDSAIALQQRQYDALKQRAGMADPETLLALSNLSSSLVGANQIDLALPLMEETLQAMGTARAGLKFDPTLSAAWQSNWRRVVDEYLVALLLKKRLADAFLVTEHYKSQLLAERISVDASERGMSVETRVALQSVRHRIAEADQAIAIKRSLGQNAATEEAQRSALLPEATRLGSAASAETRSLPVAAAPPPWFARIAAAEPNSVRISYVFIGTNLIAFVNHGTQIAVVHLGSAQEARNTIEEHRQTARRGVLSPQQGAATAEKLGALQTRMSDILIKPLALAFTGRSRALISLDQQLAHVPFDMLRLDGARLIEKMEVALTPSMEVYARLLDRREQNSKLTRKLFLGFGGAEYQRVVMLAPGLTQNLERKPVLEGMDFKAIAQSIRQRKGDVNSAFLSHAIGPNDLPGSKEEVENIARAFGAEGTAITGRQATEATLNQMAKTGELAKYRFVHFAAHGFLSDDEPALSAIVLGQLNRTPGTDGYVTVAEVSAMSLAADLVVISACDSGTGQSIQGEGLLGMSYGLFQAGASASLLTLWPVADRPTAALMLRFYQEMSSSKSLQEALAKAKRWGLANGISEAVLAAFVLHGV